MTVALTWSVGGSVVSGTLDHGSKNNGQTTTAQEIFLRHDGANDITALSLYVRQFSGTYGGAFTAATDYTEIMGWGDAATVAAFGGVQFNMDYINAYPAAQWPDVTTKTSTYGFVARTDVADTESTGITLSKNSYSASGTDGTIPVGTSARFEMRVQIPSDEDTIGIRQFDVAAVYTYTS